MRCSTPCSVLPPTRAQAGTQQGCTVLQGPAKSAMRVFLLVVTGEDFCELSPPIIAPRGAGWGPRRRRARHSAETPDSRGLPRS